MWEEAPERTCAVCGRRDRTRFASCASCGTPFGTPQPEPSRARRLARRTGVGAAAAVALSGSAAGVVALISHGSGERERDREALAAAQVAERERLQRTQAPHRGAAPHLRPPAGASRAQRLAARAALVAAAERAITRDARARARAGELDGPISGTECGPLLRDPDAVPDHTDLAKAVGRYDCVAVNDDVRRADHRSVAKLGHAFVTALDFRRFTFVWCRNTPPQSERGEALAFVRLDRACLAARGRALGTGYVDVPGS